MNVGLGISMTILILFFVIIGIGYVYVNESRENIKQINGTLTTFIKQWEHKQAIDNVRFNNTLDALHQTYNVILHNQKLIINLSDQGSHNLQVNLNLTKFNRHTLVDTNQKVTEMLQILNSSR